jgi:hypothetical protein
MPLGIGNNLIRNGGVLNPDGLSLDLQFAADKTFSKPSSLAAGETAITSRRGPSATFLRSTAATEVGPDGLIRYAPENLLIRSEELGNAAYSSQGLLPVISNVSMAPDGNTSADRIVENTSNAIHRLFTPTFNATSGTTYTASVFAKSDGRRYLYLNAGSPFNAQATFDLQNGVVSGAGIGSSAITKLNNGWYRCAVTGTATITAAAVVSLHINNTVSAAFDDIYTGDGTSGLLLWGAQLERHSTARAYIPTTTAAVYGPRFDHDPVTLACRGLLIEEGRTNLFSSTNLNDWATSRCTKTPITGIGLTNQATTLTISETGSIYIFRGATLTTGVAYAISVRVKAGTVASFGFADLTDGKYSRVFNLSTNQWAASGGAPEFTNYTVTPNVDGWFLVSAIYTPTGATGGKNIAFLFGSSVVGQTVSFDTPQLEAGSFPTSYIPTTTGTLARSADVCSITGGDFTSFYNQSEGTLTVKVEEFRRGVSYSTIVEIFNGTSYSGNRLGVVFSGVRSGVTSPVEISLFSGGTTQYQTAATSTSSGYTAAIAYATDNVRGSLNGNLLAADTPPSNVNIGANTIRFGSIGIHIASVRYYRKRLPDAKIVTLTT